MAFLSEIGKVFGLPVEEVFGNFHVVLGENAVYIEGVKKVLSLKKECICLQLKGEKIEICGNNLKIAELSDNTVSICGEISSLTRQKL